MGIVGTHLCVAACGCGGSTPPASDPSTAASGGSTEASAETKTEASSTDKDDSQTSAGQTEKRAATQPSAQHPPVQFPPKASVNDAINAVPQGTPRINMSDDAMRAPLMNMKQYEACKVPRSTRVVLTVAVYDGTAVGVDISTKPANPKIEGCVDELVRRLTWTKVPSLNTVTFNF